MSISDDIKQYPVFVWEQRKLKKIPNLTTWNSNFQLHHFIKQNVRKCDNEFYKRIEHLQKLILMPSNMHYDLHAMGEVTFFKRYGVNKNDFLFNRKKWREGYYDAQTK